DGSANGIGRSSSRRYVVGFAKKHAACFGGGNPWRLGCVCVNSRAWEFADGNWTRQDASAIRRKRSGSVNVCRCPGFGGIRRISCVLLARPTSNEDRSVRGAQVRIVLRFQISDLRLKGKNRCSSTTVKEGSWGRSTQSTKHKVLSTRSQAMQSLLQDLRFGLRSLIKHRGFTLVAVITLALGVGANSTIFSVINATLMRSLGASEPESLAYVSKGPPGGVFSYPDYAELRDQNKTLDGLIAWGGIGVSLNSNDQTDQVGGVIVTGNYFQVLGVGATKGRIITPDDDKTPGAHPVVMIGYSLWQRRFGGDENVIGKQLLINGNNFTIIGVTPKDFGGVQFGVVRDLYVPMMMQAIVRPPRGGYSGEMDPDLLKKRSNSWLFAVGRMKPGVSLQQAQADLALIYAQLVAANPPPNLPTNRAPTVQLLAFDQTDNPAQQQQLGSVARLLMSVVALVLLIACAN